MVGAMVGLTATGEFVALAWVAHQLDDLLLTTEEAEELLGLTNWDTEVELAMQNEQWCVDVVGVGQGRVGPELVGELPGEAMKLNLDQLVGI